MGRRWIGCDIVKGGSTQVMLPPPDFAPKIEAPEKPYDAADDSGALARRSFAKSLEVGYTAIRERQAAGARRSPAHSRADGGS
jgi:hypothetical protein